MSALLNFESENTDLEITKEAKVVEAYLHNSDRVTLVYRNVGSFTFRVSKLDQSKRQAWNLVSNTHQFKCVQN